MRTHTSRSSKGKGLIVTVAAAVVAGLTMAAAQSQVAMAAVEAIVEILSPTPPPATPPPPRLPAGAPSPQRSVFRIPEGDESKLGPQTPKAPALFVEPPRAPAAYVEGPLPTRTRFGRENPEMCTTQCQAVINDGLRSCDGNVNLEELTRAGRPLPAPDCRKTLVEGYRACMTGCGIDLPEAPKTPTAPPQPRGLREAGRP